MRKVSKDEVFEVLLISVVDQVPYEQGVETVFRRSPTSEEMDYFYEHCLGMRRGWVRMNENIRNLRKPSQ